MQQKPGTIERPVWPPIVHNRVYQQRAGIGNEQLKVANGRVLVSWLELETINRRSCTITEKAPTRALSWLKAATTTFTFKTLLRHYAKQVLTPQEVDVILGPI